MYPNKSQLTRAELIEVERASGRSYGFVVIDKANRAGRGLYNLPSIHLAVNNASPVKVPVSIAKQEQAKRAAKVTVPVIENVIHTERRVASNTFDSNVPEKNKNYVKFGHYADASRWATLFTNFAACQIGDSDSQGRAYLHSNLQVRH